MIKDARLRAKELELLGFKTEFSAAGRELLCSDTNKRQGRSKLALHYERPYFVICVMYGVPSFSDPNKLVWGGVEVSRSLDWETSFRSYKERLLEGWP